MKEMEKGRNGFSLGYTAALRRKVRGVSTLKPVEALTEETRPPAWWGVGSLRSRTKTERLLSSTHSSQGDGPNTEAGVRFCVEGEKRCSMDF